jgi:hypothetical protein
MSMTGEFFSPEFKEVAIRLVHSSEDPLFGIRPHLHIVALLISQNQVVGRTRSVPRSYLRENC